MAAAKPIDQYNLDLRFECSCVVLAASHQSFYDSIGHAIDPDRLSNAAASLLMRAAHAYAKEHGRGPSDLTLSMQRVRRWYADGKHKAEEIAAVVDMVGETPVDHVDERAYAAELVPVVRRHVSEQAVRTALDEFAKGTDLGRAQALIDKARRLGTGGGAPGAGQRLGMAAASEIERMRHAERLPTGIYELDIGMGGGMPRGRLGMWLAGTGVGKSTALIGQAGVAMRQGNLVAYATLELPVHEVQARLVAWHTGFPTTAIMEGACPEAWGRFESMLPSLGGFYARAWSAGEATVSDLREWVKAIEVEERRPLDLLVVDYADKLSSGDKSRDNNTYVAMKAVFEELLEWSQNTSRWTWTASASKGRARADRGQQLEAEDAADSQHKARTADVVLSATFPRDATAGDKISLFVAKNRCGKGQFGAGPLTTAFDVGRLVADQGLAL